MEHLRRPRSWRAGAGDGPLHGVVAAAGISGRFGLGTDELTAADFADVYRVNVIGSFLFVQQALPALRRGRDARVVLMGSDSGFVASQGMLPYIASKGAVRQLTAALSVELAPDGIWVNSVCPSVVDTPMARDDLGDDAFVGADFPVLSSHDVAHHVLNLLSPANRGINGTSVVCDFGYMARSGFPA
ncbi:hypothetical protein B1790_13295 [Mycobacterium sp. AT1]|nr:SDR family oxidoreductase [Mycobacterium sp. AT1]OPX10163.1 hypothetical protein B1790_13295 [Mycobacterium sp. AT1]